MPRPHDKGPHHGFAGPQQRHFRLRERTGAFRPHQREHHHRRLVGRDEKAGLFGKPGFIVVGAEIFALKKTVWRQLAHAPEALAARARGTEERVEQIRAGLIKRHMQPIFRRCERVEQSQRARFAAVGEDHTIIESRQSAQKPHQRRAEFHVGCCIGRERFGEAAEHFCRRITHPRDVHRAGGFHHPVSGSRGRLPLHGYMASRTDFLTSWQGMCIAPARVSTTPGRAGLVSRGVSE